MSHDEIARLVLEMVEGKPMAGKTEVCNAWLRHLSEIVLEWPSAVAAARGGARFDGVLEGFARAESIARGMASSAEKVAGIATGILIADTIARSADEYVPSERGVVES